MIPGARIEVRRARRPAYGVITSFAIGAICVAIATLWLLEPQYEFLYIVTVLVFLLQLGSLVCAALWAVRRAMWG